MFKPLRDPFYIALALLVAAGVAGLAWVPLLADPGFENALAQTLIIALAGTLWSVRVANRRFHGWLRLRDTNYAPAAFDQDATEALGGTIYLALFGGLVTWASTIFHPACNLTIWLQWHLLLPLISAITVPAMAFVTAIVVPGRKKGALAAALLVLGVLLYSVYRFVSEPVTMFYNPVFGYFPGPIYDSVVTIKAPLLISRGLDLCWAVLLLSSARMLVRLRHNALRHAGWLAQNLRGLELGLIAVCLSAIITGQVYRGELGIGIDRAYIERTLGGRAESAHFVYIYPRDSRVEREITRLILEHEYRYQQDIEFLGIDYPHKVTSFIYASPQQKKRLMGAAGTSYADIAGRMQHINYEPFPHPVLKHELLHVLSGPIGMPLLGFSINHGLTEGLAEACEGYSGEFLEHDWAWAMRELELLPDPRRVMSTTGFFPIQGSRAYITAGSFVGWLIDRIGIERVRKLYAWGDFEQEAGADLDELAQQWLEFIDAYPGDPRVLPAAQVRFKRKGLFETSCGRERARLLGLGRSALKHSRFTRAREIFVQALELSPGDRSALRGLAGALAGAGDLSGARRALEEAIETPGQTALTRSSLELDLGDIFYRLGDLRAARELYQGVYQRHLSPSRDRAAYVRLHALDSPTRDELMAYLVIHQSTASAMRRLSVASSIDPGDPLISYLYGRRLYSNGSYDLAQPLLDQAAWGAIPDQALRREALIMLGGCRVQLGRYEHAVEAYEALLAQDLPEGLRAWTLELIGICRLALERPELLAPGPLAAAPTP
ncbi:MAG: tetratricopeptide repeat protein [Candidatus Alcyoniella australis]|nr:tetratricopeptide repeat protein [Candidatus Alcyoniella australis]